MRHDLRTDFDDQELWQQWMDLFRSRWPLDGDGPDVVFSSEPYGDEIARRFGADAVAVDPARTRRAGVGHPRYANDPSSTCTSWPRPCGRGWRRRPPRGRAAVRPGYLFGCGVRRR